MEPILKGHFNNFINTFEIPFPQGVAIDDAEKMSSIYEKFINYTIFSADDPQVFSGNMELLDFVGPGGNGDAKIDGFGIRVNGHLVRDKNDIMRIKDLYKKIDDVEFIAVQTKMRPRFSNTELLAFCFMLRKFFSDKPPVMNDSLKEIYELKNLFFNNMNILSALKSNPSLTIYYVTVGQFKEDENYVSTLSQIEDLFKGEDAKGDYLENVNIKILDAKETRKKLESLENCHEVILNIQKSMTLTVGNNDKIKKAVSFTCSAREFLKLLENEDHTLRRTLFNDNVRDYLGAGNVNKDIEATMKDEPELFLLCNNGITIVSSNYEPIKDDLVKIINPQIVNGCQTSNTLFKLRSQIDVDKLLLSVRIICTDDNVISNKVVKSTNRQNQVLEEAFETTKPYHHELEKMFAFTQDPVQLYYERRGHQYDGDSKIHKAQIVNLRCLTQVFVAAMMGLPHEAHRHEAKLLEKYAKENRRIFSDSHSLSAYYICGLLYYRVEEALKNDVTLKKFSKFRGHLYYIIRNLISINVPILLDTSKEFKSFSSKMISALQTADEFKKSILEAAKILDNALAIWIKGGHSPYGIKDNQDFTKILTEEINKVKKNTAPTIKPVVETPSEVYLKGKILSYNPTININRWYAFIIPEDDGDNVYFDSRSYKGEVRKLVPGSNVEYILSSDISRGLRAKEVRFNS